MHHSLQGLGRAGRQACAMALHQAQGQRGKYLTLELARTRNPVENLCASVSKFQSAKIGDPMVLRPYRSVGFGWTQTIGLVQEESACAFFCWSTAVYDGDGSRSVDAESLTKR
jgi:hypothetical protein